MVGYVVCIIEKEHKQWHGVLFLLLLTNFLIFYSKEKWVYKIY